jgi:hypothetical protein
MGTIEESLAAVAAAAAGSTFFAPGLDGGGTAAAGGAEEESMRYWKGGEVEREGGEEALRFRHILKSFAIPNSVIAACTT